MRLKKDYYKINVKYTGGIFMQIRLADYVADFLVSHGVTDCFSVVGGGAMHLNDTLGHKKV